MLREQSSLASKIALQFLDIHGRMSNITVQKYKEVYSMIRKYHRSSFQARKKMLRLIQQQLKNTNATLKKIPFKRK